VAGSFALRRSLERERDFRGGLSCPVSMTVDVKLAALLGSSGRVPPAAQARSWLPMPYLITAKKKRGFKVVGFYQVLSPGVDTGHRLNAFGKEALILCEEGPSAL